MSSLHLDFLTDWRCTEACEREASRQRKPGGCKQSGGRRCRRRTRRQGRGQPTWGWNIVRIWQYSQQQHFLTHWKNSHVINKPGMGYVSYNPPSHRPPAMRDLWVQWMKTPCSSTRPPSVREGSNVAPHPPHGGWALMPGGRVDEEPSFLVGNN